jgi:hypothetical protein
MVAMDFVGHNRVLFSSEVVVDGKVSEFIGCAFRLVSLGVLHTGKCRYLVISYIDCSLSYSNTRYIRTYT